jgi:hypothetical protein
MKQETIEETAEKLQKDKYGIFISKDADVKGQLVIDTARAAFLSGMKEGAKWQAKRMYSEEPKPTIKQVDYVAKKQEIMYSEEDMRKAYDQGIDDSFDIGFSSKDDTNFNAFIEQFKKK